MVTMQSLGDLKADQRFAVGQHHEFPSGIYTVESIAAAAAGRVQVTLVPDGDGEPIVGAFDGGIGVGLV